MKVIQGGDGYTALTEGIPEAHKHIGAVTVEPHTQTAYLQHINM